MKRYKVLQINKLYYPWIGGIEKVVQNIAEVLKSEVDMEVLVCRNRGRGRNEIINNAKVMRAGSLGIFFSMPLSLSFPIMLKRLNRDILHFHLPFPLGVISYLLMRPKGKVVVTYHSDIIRQRLAKILYRPFLMKFLKRADSIITSSQNLKDNSPALKGFQDKCKVIPFGIDLEEFRLTPEIAKRAQEIKEKHKGPLILFVGRFVYYKGLEYLIEAMKNIEARLLIIGRGPLEKKLKKMAQRFAISNKIVWIGEVSRKDLISFYHACALLALPSISNNEAFGIVQLEAFTCGKPVISTNLPTGVPFVNLHQKTGLIVPPKDSEALSRAINSLLKSPNLREQYGRYARERVEKEFTRELMAQKVLKLYKT
ncbi:MAG: glycosyltransferase [Firmicutes bacterium]|jgi:rhamnosyl/mannosyltransferase|nr:glycosyltransferase [Bacillota bacterium]